MTDLVDTATYQRVTGDTATDDPTAALDDAVLLANGETNRHLEADTYTETLRVYPNGFVYPSAPPIASVSVPDVDGVAIQGAGIFLGYWNPAPSINAFWNGAIPPEATVTYIGGYTAETLPIKLRNALCRIAFNVLHPVALPGVPSGANSVSVGDVRVAAAASTTLRTLDPLDDGIKADLAGFRRQQVLGWTN